MDNLSAFYEGTWYGLVALVAALHNLTKAVGMGRLHDLKRDVLCSEVRAGIAPVFTEGKPFKVDYLAGRPIKLELDENGVILERSKELYERDAGAGKFLEALALSKELEAHE